ncbi:hypothetical protein GY45DRAFT_1327703 [Cubamyces sp. BRFM 1775]|nr:hypothetical protein GY45DRAFT_1327703 [Cubamyces sp. BRFM 1775]
MHYCSGVCCEVRRHNENSRSHAALFSAGTLWMSTLYLGLGRRTTRTLQDRRLRQKSAYDPLLL